MSPVPPATPWHLDPLELDRHLDGEGSPEERAAREADVRRDGSVAAAVRARGAFLASLGRAREAVRPAEGIESLEEKVRAALSTSPGLRLVRPPAVLVGGLAAAAAVLVGFGVGLFGGAGREAGADDLVLLAANQVRFERAGHHRQPDAPLTACSSEGSTSPYAFPLVKSKEMGVKGCSNDGGAEGATVAVLQRIEDLPAIGYVAVPEPGARTGPEIGMTELGDVVVFDLGYRDTRYYLAVDFQSATARHPGERWTCAACHGSSRDKEKNPHHIVLRRAP